jgi:uncharacterized protein (TIGR02145 family)
MKKAFINPVNLLLLIILVLTNCTSLEKFEELQKPGSIGISSSMEASSSSGESSSSFELSSSSLGEEVSSSSGNGSSSSFELSSSSREECRDGFNEQSRFCFDGVVYDKCDGQTYTPTTHFCEEGISRYAVCGYEGYNPLKQKCCVSTIFNIVDQRCGENNIVETKCGESWYDASDDDLGCQNNIVVTKCGESWYDASDDDLDCQNNIVVTKCGDSWYNFKTQFCQSENVVKDLCGTQTYLATEQCCGTNIYDINEQFCYESSKIGNKCGTRKEVFDPDLYECRAGNKIYLTTQVQYQGTYYDAVLIGTQTWLAKNLNYEAPNSRCYGDNTGGDSQSRCSTYGRLYNWETAMAVCPADWHLPTSDELTVLLAVSSEYGTNLKATSGWDSYSGSDTYGFAAFPGGYGNNNNNNFSYVGTDGYWWSATKTGDKEAYVLSIYNSYSPSLDSYENTMDFYSVRCIKNAP